MAVLNKYAHANFNSDGVLTKATPAISGGSGAQLRVLRGDYDIAAGDDINSIIRYFANVPSTWVPLFGFVGTDGVAGLTDADLGLYHPFKGGVAGAVISIDCLMNGLDLSSALDLGAATALDALDAMDILYQGKRALWEIGGFASVSVAPPHVDIALTCKTEPTGAGTVTVILVGACDT